MGEYTDHIERINIELSTRNKLRLLDELETFLEQPLPLGKAEDAEDAEITRAKSWPSARARRTNWSVSRGRAGNTC